MQRNSIINIPIPNSVRNRSNSIRNHKSEESLVSHDIHGYLAAKKNPNFIVKESVRSVIDSNGSMSKRADTIGSLTCYAKDHGMPSSETIGMRFKHTDIKTGSDDIDVNQMDITMSRSAVASNRLSGLESARLSGKYFA